MNQKVGNSYRKSVDDKMNDNNKIIWLAILTQLTQLTQWKTSWIVSSSYLYRIEENYQNYLQVSFNVLHVLHVSLGLRLDKVRVHFIHTRLHRKD